MAWSQTNEEVEVTIALPKGVRTKDIAVTIKPSLIQFRLKNGYSMGEDEEKRDPLLKRIQSGMTLFQEIDSDDSTWSLVEGQLVITLNKRKILGRYVRWLDLYR